jgi:hypothetical protein
MPNPEENFTIVKWVVGLGAGIGALTTKFLHSKLDKKLSKDVFDQYKETNNLAHSVTHSALKDIRADFKDIREDNKKAHESLLKIVATKQDK